MWVSTKVCFKYMMLEWAHSDKDSAAYIQAKTTLNTEQALYTLKAIKELEGYHLMCLTVSVTISLPACLDASLVESRLNSLQPMPLYPLCAV